MNLHEIRDEVERLHWRIHLAVDSEVWAEQIITACYNQSVATVEPYTVVLAGVAEMLYKMQLDTFKDEPWIFSTLQTRLVYSVFPKAGIRKYTEIVRRCLLSSNNTEVTTGWSPSGVPARTSWPS